MKFWLFIVIIAFAVVGEACFRLPRYDPADPDPTVAIPSIKRDAEGKSLAHAETLVQDLSSDDAAVRFYAIETLKRITGDDFGYVYYEDELRRQPAIERWRVWLAARSGSGQNTSTSSTAPATNP